VGVSIQSLIGEAARSISLITRMQSQGNANHFVSIGLNFGILLISVIPTWIVISELDHTHETIILDDDRSLEGGDKDKKDREEQRAADLAATRD
jgi:hypothetical protein